MIAPQIPRRVRTRQSVDETSAMLARVDLEFAKRERAEAGSLIRRRGYAVVWRPGMTAARQVTTMREWDTLAD